jgi:hypothetical protein
MADFTPVSFIPGDRAADVLRAEWTSGLTGTNKIPADGTTELGRPVTMTVQKVKCCKLTDQTKNNSKNRFPL